MTTQDREEFVVLRNDVDHIKSDVTEIKNNSKKLNDDFQKLTFHLIGDPSTKTKGWIERVTRFDVRLTRIEKAYAIGAGLVSAIIMYVKFAK